MPIVLTRHPALISSREIDALHMVWIDLDRGADFSLRLLHILKPRGLKPRPTDKKWMVPILTVARTYDF